MGKKGKTGDGNTDSSPVIDKRKRIKIWFFTFNNYLDFGQNGQDIYEKLILISKKFKFQEEIGKVSKIRHLQGNIEFKSAKRLTELKNIMYHAHWEITRNPNAAFDYCEKEDTCIGNKWSYGFPEEIEIINELRPFQKELEELLLLKPSNRGIYWIYDKFGNAGKTQFLKYLHVKYGAIFSYGGKKNDIINLVYNNKDYMLNNKYKIMIYNFPRDIDNKCISYDSMEQIKDGCISNNKFEAGCFVCNSPHILVFANCLPIEGKMTADKWIIKTICPETFILKEYDNKYENDYDNEYQKKWTIDSL